MKQTRINEINSILNKDFIGLKISKFAYCKTGRDFEIASLYDNSIKSCIEVTKNKKEFEKEHRKLNIFHSYCLELKQLGGL